MGKFLDYCSISIGIMLAAPFMVASFTKYCATKAYSSILKPKVRSKSYQKVQTQSQLEKQASQTPINNIIDINDKIDYRDDHNSYVVPLRQLDNILYVDFKYVNKSNHI